MEEAEKVVKIPIDKILIPEGRIRKFVRDKKFEEDKQSIADIGLIYPIEVAPADAEGFYELVAGERRLRACQELGWKEIPAFIRTRDKLERERTEIEENLRREDYTSTEKHLALARLAKILAVLKKPEPGRPEALTPEQVKKAKQLRAQGKSLSEIAEELGVGKVTVKRYLEKPETAIQAPPAESAEKIVPKTVPKWNSFETAMPVKGVRIVAEAKEVGLATVSRALKTERAVEKYPFLKEIPQSSVIQRLVSEGEACRFTVDQMKEAFEMVKEGVPPEVAVHLLKVKNLEHRETLFNWYKDKVYPAEWIAKAAEIVWGNVHQNIGPEEAIRIVSDLYAKEYRVKFPSLIVIEAMERAAQEMGVTVEVYVALVVVERLSEEGRIDKSFAKKIREKLLEE